MSKDDWYKSKANLQQVGSHSDALTTIQTSLAIFVFLYNTEQCDTHRRLARPVPLHRGVGPT